MPPPHPTIVELTKLESLKTWSLIVTLFGDLEGETLSGTQIRRLLGHIGIKSEAIRVALHRLKQDGWIVSEKQGREAIYALSERSRRETDLASNDVYNTETKNPEGWHFHLTDGGDIPDGAVGVTKELYLLPAGSEEKPEASLRLAPVEAELPDWLEARLVSPKLLHTAQALSRIVVELPEPNAPLQSLDEQSLRLLILHHWRRLALRASTWAHIGLLPNGALATCQQDVTRYLTKSKRISQAQT